MEEVLAARNRRADCSQHSDSGLSVFVPVYNEQELLVPNIQRLLAFLKTLNNPFEIIIGSNGSSDLTVSLATFLCASHPEARFFHLPRKGVGAALRHAIGLSRYARIVTVDMDLSIRLDFIPHAFRLLEDYDMVIGSKIAGTQQRGFLRRMASKAFIQTTSKLLDVRFDDYSIAAKGYRKSLLVKYLPYIDDHTFYVTEIACRAWHDGRRLTQLPVACCDTRGSRFNLLYEGIYKFSRLFILWIKIISGRTLIKRPNN